LRKSAGFLFFFLLPEWRIHRRKENPFARKIYNVSWKIKKRQLKISKRQPTNENVSRKIQIVRRTRDVSRRTF